jgi:V-type H+-transporting ATPase subunit H
MIAHCVVAPALSRSFFQTQDPYGSLLPLLAHSSNPEDIISLLTSTVLITLMANSKDESRATLEKALPVILSYLSGLTTSSDAGLQHIGVQEYSALLYSRATRKHFWAQRSETVGPLVKILQSAAGVAGESSSASLWSGTTATRSGGNEAAIGGGVGLQLLYHVLLVIWQVSFEAAEIGDDLNE